MTHICVSKLTIIGSDNGLSPGRRQAIIWTNDGILLIGPLGTNFSEILTGIQTFSLKKWNSKCCLRNGVRFVSASMCSRYFHGGLKFGKVFSLFKKKDALNAITTDQCVSSSLYLKLTRKLWAYKYRRFSVIFSQLYFRLFAKVIAFNKRL